jgi:hypothetical protein
MGLHGRMQKNESLCDARLDEIQLYKSIGGFDKFFDVQVIFLKIS